MKKQLILLTILFLGIGSFHAKSQTVIYSEDFTSGATWTLNTVVGAEGANANVWYISCQEDGQVVGVCGTGCTINDNSLHVSTFAGDLGAAYFEAGGGATNTDRRAESGDISTIGQTNLTLNFDMIGNGGNPQDFCEVFYSANGGGTWVSLATPLTSLCCGGVACTGALQGLWQNNSYLLPAACENIANLRISFVWKNIDDLIATDPSFAVDDIEITTPTVGGLTADFSGSILTICEGDCIDFTDLTTGLGTSPTWDWTFAGATTANSAVQNPTGICYPTAGTFQVDLTVNDDGGVPDTETKVGYITVVAAPNAGTSTAQNLCNNTTLDLNTLIPGADAGTWVETSGTPSGQFTVGTGVLDGNGLTIGNVYTFDYTVTGVAPCTDVTTTMTITVIDCTAGSPPIADFSASLLTICEGDCINFTDLSTLGANPTWAWTFTGAVTTASAIQNPTNICYNNAGTFQVELTVTDDIGNDTETKVGYITVNAAPNAGSDVNVNACNDATIDLDGELIGADLGGTWVETSGTPSGQFTAGTGVLDGNGLALGNVYTFTYTVTGIAPCVDDIATITVTIVDCSVLTPGFTPTSTSICVGDCITFTDNSTGPITTWDWTFASADTPTATGQDPGSICWSVPGTFDVVLTIGDGVTTVPTTISITVNPPPTVTVTATPSDTVCIGDMVTLTAGGALTYVWDNAVTDGVAFSPTATTTYTVTGTDANGCVRDAAIEVVVINCEPLLAGFSYSDNICLGDCITFTDTSSGNITAWAWDFGGGGTPNTSTDQNPVICFDAAGTYNIQLTLTDVLGANASTTNTISVFNSPIVTASLDTIIELGGSAVLVATGSGPGDYFWTPSDVVCDTCAITSASPWVNTDYIVTLTDINGCASEDTVFVLVNFIEGIGVPTAFTPNADGNNDVLYVKGFGISAMTFSIYNRYGQKVFETLTQNIGWDGTFKGRDENSGVFTWVLEYNLVNGSAGILKGNTTLLR